MSLLEWRSAGGVDGVDEKTVSEGGGQNGS